MKHSHVFILTALALLWTSDVSAHVGAGVEDPLKSMRVNLNPRPPAELWKWGPGRAGALLVLRTTRSITATIISSIRHDGRPIASTTVKDVEIGTGTTLIQGREILPFNFDPVREGTDYSLYALRTNRLPTGRYSFCVEVKYNRIAHQGNSSVGTRSDCRDFTLVAYSTPSSMTPADGGELAFDRPIRFSWTPITPVNPDAFYQIRVVEISPGQTPADAFDGNAIGLHETVTPFTSLLWPRLWGRPEPGTEYVWAVRAVDADGTPIGTPESWSQPQSFRAVAGNAVHLGYPVNGDSLQMSRPDLGNPTLLPSGDSTEDGESYIIPFGGGRRNLSELHLLFPVPGIYGRNRPDCAPGANSDGYVPYITNIPFTIVPAGGHPSGNREPGPVEPQPPDSGDARPIRFNWSPTGRGTQAFAYLFRLARVYPGMTLREALRAPIFTIRTRATYVDIDSHSALEPNRRYVWSVEALDLSGKSITGSGTRSAMHSFYARGGATGASNIPHNSRTRGTVKTGSASPFLIVNTERKRTVDFDLGWSVVRERWIELHRDLLSERDTLRAEFFDDTIVVLLHAVGKRQSYDVYSGEIPGERSEILILNQEETAVANIRRNGKTYLIRAAGDDLYRLMEIGTSPRAGSLSRADVAAAGDSAFVPVRLLYSDPPNMVDVLVLYTQDAAPSDEAAAQMRAEVCVALEEVNLSFRPSGVDLQLNLCAALRIAHREGDGYEADLNWLAHDGEVAGLREKYRADLVVFIEGTEDPSSRRAGLSYVPNFGSRFFERSGFAVVRGGSMAGQLSLAHEIGHLFGCDHHYDATSSDRTSTSPDAYAFHNGDSTWQTIMGKSIVSESSAMIGRILRWSNPDKEYRGEPTGVTFDDRSTNNAAVIERNREIVANYRTNIGSLSEVWMRDSWQDDGHVRPAFEEDEIPWDSPWLLAADQLRTAETLSGGTTADSTSVLVLVCNGRLENESGRLEIRTALPSLSPQWDTTWSIAGFTDTILSPRSTTLLRVRCPGLRPDVPRTLVARWVPPRGAHEEDLRKRDLVDLVRESNTTIWKNSRVVDMRNPTSTKSDTVEFRTIPNSRIEVVLERTSRKGNTFVQDLGTVIVHFDEAALGSARILPHGGIVDTTAPSHDRYEIDRNAATAAFSIVGGDPENIARLSLEFSHSGFPTKDYVLHLMQRSANGKLLGGRSYTLDWTVDKRLERPQP